MSLRKTLYTNFFVLSETDVKPGGPVFMNFMFTLKAHLTGRVPWCLRNCSHVADERSSAEGPVEQPPACHVFVLNVVVVSMFPCRAIDPL